MFKWSEWESQGCCVRARLAGDAAGRVIVETLTGQGWVPSTTPGGDLLRQVDRLNELLLTSPCEECHGTGFVVYLDEDGDPYEPVRDECPACHGKPRPGMVCVTCMQPMRTGRRSVEDEVARLVERLERLERLDHLAGRELTHLKARLDVLEGEADGELTHLAARLADHEVLEGREAASLKARLDVLEVWQQRAVGEAERRLHRLEEWAHLPDLDPSELPNPA